MNRAFDAVYCIALARAPHRWEHARTELARVGLRAERVDAVDGQLYVREDAMREGILAPAFEHRHSGGAVGCAASHARLWRHIAERGTGWTLILEDDCWFHPCLADPRCFAERWAVVPADADFVYLGCLSTTGDSTPGEETLFESAEPVNEHVARVTDVLHGTHAYALTAACARRLATEHLPLEHPVDHFPFDRIRMYALRRVLDPARYGVDPAAVDPAFYANTSIWGGRHTVHVHGLVSQAALPSTIR